MAMNLTSSNCSLMRALWEHGLDTYDISKRVGLSEGMVFEYLTDWIEYRNTKEWQDTKSLRLETQIETG